MQYTVLYCSQYYEGDLVVIGRMTAQDINEVARMIGTGIVSGSKQCKGNDRLRTYFFIPAVVDDVMDPTKTATLDVLVREGAPDDGPLGNLIANNISFRMAFKKSLRIS